MMVYEDRVFRILKFKVEKITGGWGKLYDEELKEDEGRECSILGGDEKCTQNFSLKA
jgi:hypothetical protein